MSICELLLYFLIKIKSKRCIDKIEGEGSSPNFDDTQNSIEDGSGEYPIKPKERTTERELKISGGFPHWKVGQC